MQRSSCRSCGNQHGALVVRYCTPCLGQMVDAMKKQRAQSVTPYGYLAPARTNLPGARS